ncbi:MAG: tRNA pseudouridine(55) synthase TruB [Candidatus Handelsmanbacteria bacterium RIFCSPLOWO2_12_FULL_64_10]|uniref:tRNA pseudouridine(55) synthase n=1 Tax=Handelsmanbacteria sp. (strain RIFCSPLOWO2_12_FULL_64_10) TaxID=1817868 RepID=A0A1F6C5A8_HANXR|nr:MAG: tRNA pseudouridine(55) synthase TruB [Candidatus Handelsmanbacteria bacterium RIFCSPLOWO2_12_FULL_64_10]
MRRLTGQKRVGHAGTLDPAAVGVLPVALGEATRFAMSSGWEPKVYWADVVFGIGTDTDDAEGRPVAAGDASGINLGQIGECLRPFLGRIAQRPPVYSAVRLGGARSYALARGGGAVTPAARQVRIDEIRVVDWVSPMLSLRIQCGAGTYIRAVARDLGEQLGCPAHLAALARLRVGPFSIDGALDYEQLDAISLSGGWRHVLWPTDLPLGELRVVIANEVQEQDFVHGRGWEAMISDAGADRVRVYSLRGTFLGLAERAGARLEPRIVLGSDC